MIAALFVATGGPYFGLDDVDPYDVKRDARLYAGPHPVVAHPPCERWGRYWYGGPMMHARGTRKTLGDDGGCFASALASVRKWGGVLEHPQASHAWRTFQIIPPLRGGGWSVADDRGGWTCCVEQGAYGHRARKATWLYAFGVELPSMQWTSPRKDHAVLDAGFNSREDRELVRRPPPNMTPEQRARWRRVLELRAARGMTWRAPEVLNKRERAETPIAFRDLLLSIARSANVTPLR